MRTLILSIMIIANAFVAYAQDAACTSTAILSVTIQDCTATEDISFLQKLTVNPNPNNGSFVLSFMSNEVANIRLDITDVTGKVIYRDDQSLRRVIG